MFVLSLGAGLGGGRAVALMIALKQALIPKVYWMTGKQHACSLEGSGRRHSARRPLPCRGYPLRVHVCLQELVDGVLARIRKQQKTESNKKTENRKHKTVTETDNNRKQQKTENNRKQQKRTTK